jgi:hypothetical protein
VEPVILFRPDLSTADELAAARRHLPVIESRSCADNNLVVGRYSVLPFYEELETDLRWNRSRLINSYEQHQWIACSDPRLHDHLLLSCWYRDLAAFTPRTWDWRGFLREKMHPTSDGPFVVKGGTNSRKHRWNELMFAPDHATALAIGLRLKDDMMIGQQPIVVREYVPLVNYEIGINGLPFSNEWRFFFLGETLLSYGYYWSEAEDPDRARMDEDGIALARTVAAAAAAHANFFALDVAETVAGGWTLIEVNDGQQSGLSMNDPDAFYRNLAAALASWPPPAPAT